MESCLCSRVSPVQFAEPADTPPGPDAGGVPLSPLPTTSGADAALILVDRLRRSLRSLRLAIATSAPVPSRGDAAGSEREVCVVLAMVSMLAHAAEATTRSFDVHQALWSLCGDVLHAAKPLIESVRIRHLVCMCINWPLWYLVGFVVPSASPFHQLRGCLWCEAELRCWDT